MKILTVLPHLQVSLNIAATCFIVLGYYFISHDNRKAHIFCVYSALTVSGLFLISYLYYHAHVGHVPFAGQGLIKPIYFTILITHLVMAVILFPLVITALIFAIKKKLTSHKLVTNWVFPIWIFVSITGVIVYTLAFHLYPSQV